jgi:hypothetical protein
LHETASSSDAGTHEQEPAQPETSGDAFDDDSDIGVDHPLVIDTTPPSPEIAEAAQPSGDVAPMDTSADLSVEDVQLPETTGKRGHGAEEADVHARPSTASPAQVVEEVAEEEVVFYTAPACIDLFTATFPREETVEASTAGVTEVTGQGEGSVEADGSSGSSVAEAEQESAVESVSETESFATVRHDVTEPAETKVRKLDWAFTGSSS